MMFLQQGFIEPSSQPIEVPPVQHNCVAGAVKLGLHALVLLTHQGAQASQFLHKTGFRKAS